MMILMPFHGQMKHLVIFFLEEITAQMERQRSFHHAGRSMKTPLQEFQPDIAAHIDKGIVQHMGAVLDYPADEPAKKKRVHGIDQVGAYEHGINEDVSSFFPAGITPGSLQKGDIRIGHLQ